MKRSEKPSSDEEGGTTLVVTEGEKKKMKKSLPQSHIRSTAPSSEGAEKHSLLPALAKNMPQPYFLNASRPHQRKAFYLLYLLLSLFLNSKHELICLHVGEYACRRAQMQAKPHLNEYVRQRPARIKTRPLADNVN